MKESIIKRIEEAANELGFEVEVRDEYSGRGMFGETAHAIVMNDENDFYVAAISVAFKIDNDTEESDDFIQDMQDITFDSMGSSIVAY